MSGDPSALDLGDGPEPAKPVGPMPTDEELAQQDEPGQEDVPDDHIMSSEDADADDTVDDKEDDLVDREDAS